MLKEGDAAPDFQLQDECGCTLSLKNFRGHPLVIYFFPRADTPGCTIEAKEFGAIFGKFQKEKAAVVGVSPDTPEAQAKFKKKYDLPFTLLCDTEHKMAEAYGVWREKNLYGKKVMGVARTTFVIDAKGRIKKIFEKVKPEGHAAEVLAALQS